MMMMKNKIRKLNIIKEHFFNMNQILNRFIYTRETKFRPNPFPSVLVYVKKTTYFLGIPIKNKIYESKSNR